MEKLVYSVAEVAAALGISKSYAYHLVKTNSLPTVKLGKRRIIPKDLLEKWLQENINSTEKSS